MAMGPGSSEITAKLQTDPSVTVKVQVKVEVGGRIPESLALTLDTLYVPAGGASRIIPVKVLPLTASTEVTWRSDNSLVAAVAEDGAISGLVIGLTKVWATSKIKSSLFDSAWVMVTEPIRVASVRFISDSVDIFIGGAAELLEVEILPLEANQTVEFTVLDPVKVELKDNRIRGLTEGQTTVTVKSKEDPSKSDILKVKIHPNQHVDSVRVSPKTLKLFVGGDKLNLTGEVHPASAPQAIQWVSGNKAYATVDSGGKVTGVAAGNLKVYAYSQADSLAKDSAAITVKVDPPVVRIGEDTVVSVGQTITFLPMVESQEFGLVTGFKWDLNGDSAWDSSAAGIRSVSYKFDQEKVYKVRFWVKDTEGNETEVSKSVRAVKGAVVLIQSPPNNSYSRVALISVKWTVDGAEQDSLLSQTLKDGPNIITRTIKDVAGTPFSHSITVTLDSVAPNKPRVHGPAASNSATPTWTWSSGGGGGNGTYRFRLDGVDLSASPETKDTLYTPASALTEGIHTLNVQERDAAGNWSASGILVTMIDRTGPAKPIVKINVASPSKEKKPKWTWMSGGGGNGLFQYKFGSTDFTAGASIPAADSQFIPGTNLGDGLHTLYVRERDSLGNWSEPGSAAITIDTTPPGAPKILASTPTGSAPKWTWTSGGGGNSTYRFKVGGEPSAATETGLVEYVLSGAVSKTSYTLYVQERDAVGNWSPVSSQAVMFDLEKPTVTIIVPVAQTDGLYLTKLAVVDLGGTTRSPHGVGSIKSITYTVDGVAGGLSTNLAGDGSWSIKALPLTNNETITVKVMARDAADNVGEATLNIQMDNTPPTITEIDIPEGFITNSSSITINFKKDKVSDTILCALRNDTSAICSKTVYDAANNSAIVSRTVWYRNNVVFVRQGKTGGNGSSWDAAYGDIPTAISSIGGKSGTFEIWVGDGSYSGFELSRSNTSIFGGFNSTGYPNSTSSRSLQSKISRIRPNAEGQLISISGESPVVCRNTILDGFHINDEVGQAISIFNSENARLENFWIEANRKTEGGAGLIAVANADVVFQRVYIRDNYVESYHPVYLYSGGKLEMYNSEIINNTTSTSWGGAGIHHEGGGGMTIRSSLLYKNSGGNGNFQVFSHNGGLVDIDACTVHFGRVGVRPLVEDDPDSQAIKWGPNNKTY